MLWSCSWRVGCGPGRPSLRNSEVIMSGSDRRRRGRSCRGGAHVACDAPDRSRPPAVRAEGLGAGPRAPFLPALITSAIGRATTDYFRISAASKLSLSLKDLALLSLIAYDHLYR